MPSHLRAFAKNQNEKVHRLRETSKEEIAQQLGAIDIFTDPACRKATLIMFVIWNSTNLGMQRITLSKVSLEFNNKIFLLHILTPQQYFTMFVAVYFGIAMSATNLSSNVYLAFILSALVETPSLVNIWFMNHWGRKPTLTLALSIAGFGCIIGGFTSGYIRMIMVLLG